MRLTSLPFILVQELIPNDAQLQGFNNFEGQKMLESTGSDDQALESGADATAANDAQALFGGGRYQGDGTAYSESVCASSIFDKVHAFYIAI